MATTETMVETPREITDEELARYREHGWVKLERLVSPEFALAMRDAAAAEMGGAVIPGEAGGQKEEKVDPRYGTGGKAVDIGMWQDYHFIARDSHIEPMYSFVFSKEMGRTAQRFMFRDVPVQFSSDLVACKMPVPHAGSGPTTWHQDLPTLPFDRVGSTTFWLALDEIAPEMGALQFVSGSQREGPLGNDISAYPNPKKPWETFPYLLDEHEISKPNHLMPGDATVHNANTLHGADPNTGDRPRWAYIMAYFPADTLFNGAPNHNFDGLDLQPNAVIRHPRFPIIYP